MAFVLLFQVATAAMVFDAYLAAAPATRPGWQCCRWPPTGCPRDDGVG